MDCCSLVLAVIGLIVVYSIIQSIDDWVKGLSYVSTDSSQPVPPPRPAAPPQNVPNPPPADKDSAYTADWGSISRRVKKEACYRCALCGVNCGQDKRTQRLLHVHHFNLNPKDNSPENLVALCVICHSEQPGAGHKRLAGAIRSDGRYWEVQVLRNQMGSRYHD